MKNGCLTMCTRKKMFRNDLILFRVASGPSGIRLLSMSSHTKCKVPALSGESLSQLINEDRNVRHYLKSADNKMMIKNSKPYLLDAMERISQAKRSVIVRNTMNSQMTVRHLCSEFGKIKYMQVCPKTYEDPKQQQPAVLIEFADQKSADAIIASSESKEDFYVFNCAHSRIITFLPPPSMSKSAKSALLGSYTAAKPNVKASLQGQTTLRGCVQKVKETLDVSELQVRRSYMQCQLINDLTRHHMPDSVTIPHGSLLSGLATIDSDLDMVLHPLGLAMYDIAQLKAPNNSTKFGASFSSVLRTDVSRFEKDMINFVGFMLRNFAKYSCTRAIPLPNAKCPIIRYDSYVNGGRCDLTVDLLRVNDGVISSCILRSICDHLPLFQYMSHCLRFWARQWRLTSPHPGKYLINFTLTHLLIYYLQHKRVLPPIHSLLESSSDITAEKSHFKRTDEDLTSLGELYQDFFSFWSTFDYTQLIDINTAIGDSATHHSLPEFAEAPMKVVNTQNPEKNIAFRMDKTYHDMFVSNCKRTHKLLTGQGDLLQSFLAAHRL